MLYCQSVTYPLAAGMPCYIDQPRFLDKQMNDNERSLYDSWWQEQITMYGMKVDYYVHGYSLSAHDFLFGEHPTAKYAEPKEMFVVADVSNDSILLSKFGITSTADITIFVHITTYHEIFGVDAEPKSGDLIFLKEYGSDRPGGREGQVYEVTERDDEAINATNQLMGHYVWMIKGTRYDYSFEHGAKKEAKNDQVYDNTRNGIIQSTELSASNPKLYTDNVTDTAGNNFNYGAERVNTDPYGEY